MVSQECVCEISAKYTPQIIYYSLSNLPLLQSMQISSPFPFRRRPIFYTSFGFINTRIISHIQNLRYNQLQIEALRRDSGREERLWMVSCCAVTLIHLIDLHAPSYWTFAQVYTVPWGLYKTAVTFFVQIVLCACLWMPMTEQFACFAQTFGNALELVHFCAGPMPEPLCCRLRIGLVCRGSMWNNNKPDWSHEVACVWHSNSYFHFLACYQDA